MVGAELFDGTGCANAVLGVGRLRRGTPHALFRSRKSIGELRRNVYDVAIALSEAQENALILRLLRSHIRSRLESSGGGISIARALERIAGRLSGGKHPSLTPPTNTCGAGTARGTAVGSRASPQR